MSENTITIRQGLVKIGLILDLPLVQTAVNYVDQHFYIVYLYYSYILLDVPTMDQFV